MRKIILVSLTFVLLGLVSQVSKAVDEAVYIDVRTWLEHKVDHIDGDTRIHVSEIVDGVSEQYPDKKTPIKLYCERGVRAQTALQKLEAAGYLNVENVGGIDEVRESRRERQVDG